MRVRDHRATQGQHLTLATGQLCGVLLASLLEDGKQCVLLLEARSHVGLRAQSTETKILFDGEFRDNAAPFRHVRNAQSGDGVGTLTDEGVPIRRDAAGTWLDEAADGAQQRRLARTVGPEDRRDGAGRRLNRDVVEGRDGAVGNGEVGNGDHSSTPKYASITAGLWRTSAGVPVAMTLPKLRTTRRSTSGMTKSMLCSTSNTPIS